MTCVKLLTVDNLLQKLIIMYVIYLYKYLMGFEYFKEIVGNMELPKWIFLIRMQLIYIREAFAKGGKKKEEL